MGRGWTNYRSRARESCRSCGQIQGSEGNFHFAPPLQKITRADEPPPHCQTSAILGNHSEITRESPAKIFRTKTGSRPLQLPAPIPHAHTRAPASRAPTARATPAHTRARAKAPILTPYFTPYRILLACFWLFLIKHRNRQNQVKSRIFCNRLL